MTIAMTFKLIRMTHCQANYSHNNGLLTITLGHVPVWNSHCLQMTSLAFKRICTSS